MEKNAPIPYGLWSAVPNSLVEKLVNETNLQASIYELWHDMDKYNQSGKSAEKYGTKVDILVTKAQKLLANVASNGNRKGALEALTARLAWCVRTETTVNFLRDYKNNLEKILNTSSRESAHNLFEVMSRSAINKHLTEHIRPHSLLHEPYYKNNSKASKAADMRNLVWHEVKRGNINNINYLLEIIDTSSHHLVLGTPFFQEGMWDAFSEEQLPGVQKYIHSRMGFRERKISINFAWLAGTEEGQRYIENVCSKLAPKPYKSLEAELNAWEAAMKPDAYMSETAYLLKYVDLQKLGAPKGGGLLLWDFNPFGKRICDIIEKSLINQPNLSIDQTLAGVFSSFDRVIPHPVATAEIVRDLQEHNWNTECFEPGVQTGLRLATLLGQFHSRLGGALCEIFLTGLAATMAPQDIEELLELVNKQEDLQMPAGVAVPVRINAEQMFCTSWKETLKNNQFRTAKWLPEVYTDSSRGATLLLDEMILGAETPLMVDGKLNYNVTIDLESLLSITGTSEAAAIAWNFFEIWEKQPGHLRVIGSRSWFKSFINSGFFDKLMEGKSIEFWEQFITLYFDHEQSMTPPAILKLTEAVTS